MTVCPCVVHITNPLVPKGRRVFDAKNGSTLRSLTPKTRVPTLCLVNGEYVLRDEWDSQVTALDHVTFVTLPQGGGSNPLLTVLALVAVVVGVYTGNAYLIAGGLAMLAGGLIMSNVPLPETSKSPSPTYSIALAGNVARLGEAMPIPYGRHIITPDFAAPPYVEYANDQQFYHALFCIGVFEKHTLERIMIDDTSIAHFSDVQYQVVGPQYTGVTLNLVNPCVVTAPEVADQDLIAGKPVGPFTICGPKLTVNFIGVDISCPRGLYLADNSGNLGDKSLSWNVQYRKVKDDGTVDGPWLFLATESLTARTSTPLRRSYKYPVAVGRYEVRVERTDVRDENVRAAHDLKWIGLRAYLSQTATLEPAANYVAVRIRASDQLSGLSQRRFSVVQRRWLKTWDPVNGWSDYKDTNSIAWAMVDVLKNQNYGAMIDDSRIDLLTFYQLDQRWKKRTDSFNGIFDRRITVWNALRAIAAAGRAAPLMRGSMFTCVRDSKYDLPVAAFTMTNIVRGSFTVEYSIFSETDADGIEGEYFDQISWSSQYVRIPYPGLEESVAPARCSSSG